MAECKPRGWRARLWAMFGGPSLTWVAIVAIAGVVMAVWIGDPLDGYRRVGYVVGLFVTLGTLVMAAANAPREAIVRAPRERRRFSWSIGLLLALSLAVTVLSLLSSVGGQTTAPWAGVAAAALAFALLVAAATIASKRVFRLTALVAVVLIVGSLAILGTQKQEQEGAPSRKSEVERKASSEVTLTEAGEVVPSPKSELVLRASRETPRRKSEVEYKASSEVMLTEAGEVVPSPKSELVLKASRERPAQGTKGITQLVAGGADRVIKAPNLFGDGAQPGLDVAGYIALGLLLVLGYRQLELRNNRQYGTPVEVAPLTGVTKSRRKALTQRLRERIVDADIEGPGMIPGSTSDTALSDLLTEAEGLPNNKLAAAFVTFFQAVAFPPAGVKVTVAVAKRKDGDREYLEASVEVATRVSNQTVLTTVVTGKNKDPVNLIDKVADVVATNAINYSQRTPRWEHWQDETGGALGRFRRVQHARSSGVGEPDTSIGELEKAVRSSPATGSLRMALAHKYDTEGRRLDALLLHLQTATDYPTWIDSRYRLATSLLMVADGDDMLNVDPVTQEGILCRLVMSLLGVADGGHMQNLDSLTQRRIRDLLECRYANSTSSDSKATLREALTPATGDKRSNKAEDLRKELRKLAVQELDVLDRWLGHPWLLWFALRKDGGGASRDLLRNREERKRRRTACRTVRLRAEIQIEAAGRGRVDELLNKLDRAAPWTTESSPTAHYNVACVYALPARRGEKRPRNADLALRHLEEALRRGGPELFDRKWLKSDPDLAALRGNDRFQVIVRAFTPEPSGEPSASAG